MGNFRIGNFYPLTLGWVDKIYCGNELCWPVGDRKRIALRQMYVNGNGDYEFTDEVEYTMYFMKTPLKFIDDKYRYSVESNNGEDVVITNYVSNPPIDLIDITNDWVNKSYINFYFPYFTDGQYSGGYKTMFTVGSAMGVNEIENRLVYFAYEPGVAFANLWKLNGDLLDFVQLKPQDLWDLLAVGGERDLTYDGTTWARIKVTSYSENVAIVDVSTITAEGLFMPNRHYYIQNDANGCRYVGDAGASNGYMPDKPRLILNLSCLFVNDEYEQKVASIPWDTENMRYLDTSRYFLNYPDGMKVNVAHVQNEYKSQGTLLFTKDDDLKESLITTENRNFVQFVDDRCFGTYKDVDSKVVYLYVESNKQVASLWSTSGELLESMRLDPYELYRDYISNGISRVVFKHEDVIWLILDFTTITDGHYRVSAKVIQADNTYEGPINNNMTNYSWDEAVPERIVGIFPDDPVILAPKIKIKQTYKSLTGVIVTTEVVECEVPYEDVEEGDIDEVVYDDRRYIIKSPGKYDSTTVISHPKQEGKSDDNIWKIKNIRSTLTGYTSTPTVDIELDRTGRAIIPASVFDDMLIDADKELELEFIYEEYVPIIGKYVIGEVDAYGDLVKISIDELFFYDEEDPYYEEYSLSNGKACNVSLYSEKKSDTEFALHELIYEGPYVKLSGDFEEISTNRLYQNIYRTHNYRYGYEICTVHPITGTWASFAPYNAIGRTEDDPWIEAFVGQDGVTYTITAYDATSKDDDFAKYYTEGGSYLSPGVRVIISNDKGKVYDRIERSEGMNTAQASRYSPIDYIIMNETLGKFRIWGTAEEDRDMIVLNYLRINKGVNDYYSLNNSLGAERAWTNGDIIEHYRRSLYNDRIQPGDDISDAIFFRNHETFDYNGQHYGVYLYWADGTPYRKLAYRLYKYHIETLPDEYNPSGTRDHRIYDGNVVVGYVDDLTKDVIYILSGEDQPYPYFNITVVNNDGLELYKTNSYDVFLTNKPHAVVYDPCLESYVDLYIGYTGYGPLNNYSISGHYTEYGKVTSKRKSYSEDHTFEDGDVVFRLPAKETPVEVRIVYGDGTYDSSGRPNFHEVWSMRKDDLYDEMSRWISQSTSFSVNYGTSTLGFKIQFGEIGFNVYAAGDIRSSVAKNRYVDATGTTKLSFDYNESNDIIIQIRDSYVDSTSDKKLPIYFYDDTNDCYVHMAEAPIAWEGGKSGSFTYRGTTYKTYGYLSGDKYIVELRHDINDGFYYKWETPADRWSYTCHFMHEERPCNIILEGVCSNYSYTTYTNLKFNMHVPYAEGIITKTRGEDGNYMFMEKVPEGYHVYMDTYDGGTWDNWAMHFDKIISAEDLWRDHTYYYNPYSKNFETSYLGGINVGTSPYDSIYPSYIRVVDFNIFMRDYEKGEVVTYPLTYDGNPLGRLVCSHDDLSITYTCYDVNDVVIESGIVSGNNLNDYYNITIESDKVPPYGGMTFIYVNKDHTGVSFMLTSKEMVVGKAPFEVTTLVSQMTYQGNYMSLSYAHDGNNVINWTLKSGPNKDNITNVKESGSLDLKSANPFLVRYEYEPVSNNRLRCKIVVPDKVYNLDGTFDQYLYGDIYPDIFPDYYDFLLKGGNIVTTIPLVDPTLYFYTDYDDTSTSKQVSPNDGDVIIGTYDFTVDPPLFIDGVIA